MAASDPPAPGDRWQLARSYANLAMLLRSAGRPDEAEALCLEARDLQKDLRRDFPDVPDYRHELASILNNLGLLRKEGRHAPEAGSAFREALELQEALVADSPHRPDYRLSLAVTRLNLASAIEPGDPRSAARVYRDALSVQERLTADFPEVSEYQSAQGRTLYSLARLQLSEGDDSARDLLTRAIRYHRAVVEADPRDRANREFLRDDYSVLCLALLHARAHADAANAAEELPKVLPDDASESLRAAAFLVECGAAASDDPSAPDSYARRAVALLRRAVERQILTDPASLQIPELAPLRARPDFEDLRKTLVDRSRIRAG
jgi:tetratricopeptide (TPR) repeat protein